MPEISYHIYVQRRPEQVQEYLPGLTKMNLLRRLKMANPKSTNRGGLSHEIISREEFYETRARRSLYLGGQRFGRLVATRPGPKRRGRATTWVCRCDCGNINTVETGHLRNGVTKSCGCLRAERMANMNLSHGKSGSRTFTSWTRMRSRCHYEGDDSYAHYGGRGIGICDRWSDFENFYEDMGDPPKGHSLDRKDTDGDYGPDNCQWSSALDQNRNKTNNIVFEFQGQERCLSEWADIMELPYNVVWQRVRRLDWPIEKALSEPVEERNFS